MGIIVVVIMFRQVLGNTMVESIYPKELIENGLPSADAEQLADKINKLLGTIASHSSLAANF